jgi:hypothetical protein
LVCVLGLALIVYSRQESHQAATTTSTTTSTTQASTTPPTLADHWEVAVSLDVCGKVVNLPRSANQDAGVITSGNGVVDVEPARAGTLAPLYEGAKATLSQYLSLEGVGLTDTSLKVPHSLGKLAGTYNNGRSCSGGPGKVEVLIWGSPTTKVPFPATQAVGIRYGDGNMFMVAFVPKGASVPRPLAESDVAAFLKAATTTTTTQPTTTTTKPATTTTTGQTTSTTS